MIISLIFAMDERNGIGKDNRLPWHLPADLQFFKRLTTGHSMIMGRKTYESIGRPLPNRTSIVITNQKSFRPAEGVVVKHSLKDALDYAQGSGETEVFIIGGASVAKEVLHKADRFYLTRIHHEFDADVFFPEFDMDKWEIIEE